MHYLPPDKERAREFCSLLVTRFHEQYYSYKRSDYNETQVRRDFIDPFFKALGWDMDNSQGYAEAYREVIHEDRVKVSGVLKAPDYSFRLPGGKRLFFLEAKKPAVKVKTETDPAYQVRRYAWSAKLPISLLTDFEELSIYDCTQRPEPKDSASKARLKYLTFEQYVPEFDFLWNTFSKEQVLKGSFDRFLKSDTHKRGTSTVDAAFLKSLDAWRTYLATSVSLRNHHLDEDAINFVVQHTLDRLIFLRIAEDRGVEPYGQLKAILGEKGEHYPKLFELFQHADRRYNSGLFDFKKDQLSETLFVDNKVVRTIVEDLYYPKSPYAFNVISVEILGSAYEQFLGKQIRIGTGHRARIEEKPEVRHAGGVYYTPQYIVDHIVQRTVGELVKGRKPDEVAKLRIVDPACGSGSFLLGAYQYLLNWHKEQYGALKRLGKGRKSDKLRPDGELTTAEKKRILVNNIFGVDLDANAVEVTKLSLLLKCMEGETEASINQQLALFHDRVLPTLDKNIQCGNSLIDTDWYDDNPDGDGRRVKPFNWQRSFLEVFKQGGFDAVIGNPPYIRVQVLQDMPGVVGSLSKNYRSAAKGNYDIYVTFIEKAMQITHASGRIGYILPHKFFNAKYGEGIRSVLHGSRSIESIIHFGHQQVFDGATTYTCILLLNKGRKQRDLAFTRVEDLDAWRDSGAGASEKIPFASFGSDEWNFLSGAARQLHERLMEQPLRLRDVATRIFQGLKTSADKIFTVDMVKEDRRHLIVHCLFDGQQYKVERDLFHPLIKGGDSKGYVLNRTNRRILFPYGAEAGQSVRLIPFGDIECKYPDTARYLRVHKRFLSERENGRMKERGWHGYIYPKALDIMNKSKLFTPDISPKAAFGLDATGEVYFTGGVSGGYGLLISEKYSDLYILGLLNSRLLDWCVKQVSTQMRGGWYSYESKYIRDLPIAKGTPQQQKEMVALVKQMLNLKAQEGTATGLQATQLADRIVHVEEKINGLVYALYGLGEKEIMIVEKS